MYDNLRQPKFKRKGKKKAPLVAERSLQYKILTYYETLFLEFITIRERSKD